MHKNRLINGRKGLAALLLAGIMAFTVSCGSSEEGTTAVGSTEDSGISAQDPGAADAAKLLLFKETHKVDDAAITGEGFVNTFLTENITDKKVKNGEDAEAVLESVIDKLGGNENVSLDLDSIRPTETGLTYYTFIQLNSDVRVYGAAVKLVADKDGNVLGINSTIVPGLTEKNQGDWVISAEDAEKIVEKQYSQNNLKVVAGTTEAALIPMEQGSDTFYYAWIVYTPAVKEEYDAKYTAHYVSMAGNYLYNAPTQEPGNSSSRSGAKETFDFSRGRATEETATITHTNGTTEEIKFPVIITEDNTVYLADAERKILVADYVAFVGNDEVKVRTSTVEEGGSFSNLDVLTYYNTIRIYDFFKEMGWDGADGEGTPILLLMGALDQEGNPSENANYYSKVLGYQVFTFDETKAFGDCVDVMAHEYTHCVSGTFMTVNLYQNDSGAINEALSDIIGNLVEMGLDGPEEGYWLIGENLGSPIRDMAEPGKKGQPAYVGDCYYVPTAKYTAKENDQGGVHRNSSLLNLISYKLFQAGMDVSDQIYFWMNVSMSITPRNDYPDLAKLLPWCLKQTGFEKYMSALNKAIEETGIASHDIPAAIPNGCARLNIDYDFRSYDENYNIMLAAIPTKAFTEEGEQAGLEDEVDTWPSADNGKITVAVPADTYIILVTFSPRIPNDPSLEERTFLFKGDGWELSDMATLQSTMATPAGKEAYFQKIDAGATIDLKTEELKKLVEGN